MGTLGSVCVETDTKSAKNEQPRVNSCIDTFSRKADLAASAHFCENNNVPVNGLETGGNLWGELHRVTLKVVIRLQF